MSFNAGGIQYQIEVETKALLDAKEVTDETMGKIQTAMAKTELATKNYSDELKKMGYVVSANGTVMQQNGAVLEAQTQHMQNLQRNTELLNAKLKSTKPAFAVSGNSAQMAGYQIGDFATQVASGQSAIVAFTQQATQMLGAFGTAGAVAGAVLAIVGALTVALAPALLKGRDYSKELESALESLDKVMTKSADGTWEMSDNFDGLNGKLKGLSDVIKKSLENDLKKAIEAATAQTVELAGALKDVGSGLISAGVDDYIRSFRRFGIISTTVEGFKEIWTELGVQFGYTGQKATDAGEKIFRALEKADRLKTPESMKELTQEVINLGTAAGAKPTEQITNLIKTMVESTGSIEKMKDAIANLNEALAKSPEADFISDLKDKIAILNAELAGGEAAAMKVAAAQKLQKKSTAELSAEINKEIDAYVAAKDAIDKKKESEREAEKADEKRKAEAEKRVNNIKKLTDGLEAERMKLSMTTLQWELYSKTQEAIANGASEEVIQQIWDQVTAIDALKTKLNEEKEARDKAAAAEKERIRILADKADGVVDKNKEFKMDQMDPLDALQAQQEAELKIIQDANAQKLLVGEQFEQAMTDMKLRHMEERKNAEMAQNQQLLSASANFLGDMANLAGQSGKKAFAAQKVFATASAALNFSSALAQAMADPSALTLPQKIANYGLVVSTFASLMGSIKGASYGGGRMYGGPVQAGRYYQINETGAPEIYSAGGKDYLMATENAKIKPASSMGGGGGWSGNVIINNNAAGVEVSQRMVGTDTIIEIAQREAAKAAKGVYNQMTNEVAQNSGKFFNAMSRNTTVKGRPEA